MDDFGKSDRPIVPANAANCGAQPTESREGRGRPKGNARQGRSHRMQCRARLSQALARVRQAAVRDRTARADPRVLRHLRKWLRAGVVEEGQVQMVEYGTPQGGSISPLLANIYLHYAFDNWAATWQRDQARGEMLLLRYADDIVVCFQYREDAERFQREMADRLGRFHLDLNLEKTRLIEFGRFAAPDRRRRGQGKPETFDFLGFTHACGATRSGEFAVKRLTARKKLRAKLQDLKRELRRRLHDSLQ